MNDPVDEVLSRLHNVERRHGYWIASCPTRKDRNPSMTVAVGDDGRVLLHDFGGATVEEIVESIGMTVGDLFMDDPLKRRDWMDEKRRERGEKKKAYAKPVLPEAPTFREGAVAWFASRGIHEETMRRFGIYTGARQFRKAGHSPAICFPYRKGGEVVNIKYRAVKEKDFAMESGAEPVWYNVDAVGSEARTVVIVEGEIDVLSLAEAGYAEVISPPGGCDSISTEVFLSGKHFLGDDRVRVLLAGDGDGPGQGMMDEVARRVGKERCARVYWPEGCKDANDTLVKYGVERVRECVENAIPLPVDGIISIDDAMDGVWSLYAEGMPPGTSTGIPALDEIYTVKTGYWTTVIASPSAGKSNFLDQVMVNLAELSDWKFAIASLENPDVPRHIANIMPKYARKPFGQGPSERMTSEDVERGRAWMRDHFFFIQPEQPSIEEILMRAKALVFSQGIKGLVLDPWNEMEHPPQGLNSGDYISRCLTMIRRFAFAHDIHIWLVVHPTKLVKDSSGQYPMPSLYDASGSALFNSKTDYGLCMWRDRIDFTAPVQVKCDKSRHQEVAKLGTVMLGYDPVTTRYYDLDATGEDDSPQHWRPKTFAERMDARDEGDLFEDEDAFLTEVTDGVEV